MRNHPERPCSVFSPLLLRSMSVEFEKTWAERLAGRGRVHRPNNWFVCSFPDFLMIEAIA